MDHLIEPDALRALLPTNDALLIHIGSEAGYQAGHIPGAVLVTPAQLIDGTPPAVGRLPSIERLGDLFASLGYQPHQRIVAYDDEGGGWAGRFIWTLDVIGHSRWQYLNGGIHAWHADGLPLEQSANERQPTVVSLKVHEGPIAEVGDVLESLNDGKTCVWDCRSRDEYLGTKQTANRAGHIPGAVNLDWLELMDPARGMRLREDLSELLERHGILSDRPLITHCQTHHRSGLSYLVARLLHFDTPRAYHGSWSEWGNRDDTPIATGNSAS